MTRVAILVLPCLVFTGAAAADIPEPQQQQGLSISAHNPRARRITDALGMLEADGYGNFHDFHADGTNFAAVVTKDGGTFEVLVDPDDGRITRQG